MKPDAVANIAMFLGGLGVALALTPLVMRLARRIGAIDVGGYRKFNGRNIPLMGGLAVAVPFLGACLWGLLHPDWLFGRHALQDWAILLVGGGFIVALGVIDDLRGLRAKTKFAAQFAVAILVLFTSRRIEIINLPLLGSFHCSFFTGALLSVLWIIGIINAINLIDGIDGLAGGVGLIATLGMGLVGLLNGQAGVFALSLLFAGSLAGFLVFNYHPAKCFLGDTGSLFIGFVLATLGLMSGPSGQNSFILAPILILGFPIFDTLTSMARRILRGRSPFTGDRGHVHHRLLDAGCSQRQAALVLYGVTAVCVMAGLLFQLFYAQSIHLLMIIGCFGLIFGLMAWSMGLLRPRQIVRVAQCRERNSRLANFSKYASVALKTHDSALTLMDVLRLGCRTLNLNFLEVSVLDQPELVTGYYGEKIKDHNGNGSEKPCDSVRVTTAEGEWLLIRFRVNPPETPAAEQDPEADTMQELEREDVMACIANVFHGSLIELIRTEKAAPEKTAEAGTSLATPVDPVMNVFVAPRPNGLGAAQANVFVVHTAKSRSGAELSYQPIPFQQAKPAVAAPTASANGKKSWAGLVPSVNYFKLRSISHPAGKRNGNTVT